MVEAEDIMNKRIWPVLILAFLVSGCRESYFAEKQFYKASQLRARGASYEAVLDAFSQVVSKYPGTYKAAESLFVIAELKLKQKEYEAARQTLKQVIQNFSNWQQKVCDARHAIAKSYEVEGRWTDAEKAYWETAEYHSLEVKGLYAPIQVVTHYQKAGDIPAKDQAYQRAMAHYKKILHQIGPIQVAAQVRNYTALLDLMAGNREKAKEEWLSIAKDFPKDKYYAPLSILAAADASAKGSVSEEALALYERFLKDYPRHELAGKTAVRLGLLYVSRRDFSKGREWFEQVVSRYFSKDKAKRADVKLLIAKTYEQEGSWAEAEKVYEAIEQNEPLTTAALQVPFLRSDYYEAKGDQEKAKQILNQAAEHYKDLERQQPNVEIGQYARRQLQSVYIRQGDWDQVLVNIDEDLHKERNARRQGEWFLLKALITEKRLQDKTKATALYQDFLKRYSDHPLVGVAKSHLEALSN